MTMVALTGHPTKSASPSPTTIISIRCQVPQEPTATYLNTQHPETHDFYSNAVLRDIPTDVPTTAAALDADDDDDDDDRGRSCHPSTTTDAIYTIDPTFLQEWDAFYTDFLAFVNSTGASTPSTNENTIKQEHAGSVVATSASPALPERTNRQTETTTIVATSDNCAAIARPADRATKHNDIISNAHAHDDRRKDDRAIDDGDNDEKDKTDADGGHDDCATAKRHANDRATNQRANDDLANSIVESPPNPNEEPLESLSAAPKAVDSAAPAHADDPEAITTFLSELDNLSNELHQLMNDRATDQRINDDDFSTSIGASTPSNNAEQLESLSATHNAVASAAPSHADDSETIATFLSELDNMHNELLQLRNDRTTNQQTNDDDFAPSIGASTASNNAEQLESLYAAPNAVASAAPAQDDDPATIATFLSELDNLHNELLQLRNDRATNQQTNDNVDHSIGASTPSTKTEQLTLPAAHNAVDSDAPAHDDAPAHADDPETIATFLTELDDMHNELLQLIHLSSANQNDTRK